MDYFFVFVEIFLVWEEGLHSLFEEGFHFVFHSFFREFGILNLAVSIQKNSHNKWRARSARRARYGVLSTVKRAVNGDCENV